MSRPADWAVRTLEHLYGGELACDQAFAQRCLREMGPGLDRGLGVGFSLLDVWQKKYRFLLLTCGADSIDLSDDPRMLAPADWPAEAVFLSSPPLSIFTKAVDGAYLQRIRGALPHPSSGLDDMIGLPSMPVPGMGLTAWVPLRGDRMPSPRERLSLWRLSLHLETATRLRLQGGSEVGRITSTGRLALAGDVEAEEAERLRFQVRQVDRLRLRANRGAGDEALAVWSALVGGHLTVVADSASGTGYLLFENPPRRAARLGLVAREQGVLEEIARGMSHKEAAWALGLSQSQVSMALASAAMKLGLRHSRDAVALARLLLAPSLVDTTNLSAAEQDVLDRLGRGLSNADIARERGTSMRTVANQVAAILRKTGKPSRMALLGVQRSQGRRAPQAEPGP